MTEMLTNIPHDPDFDEQKSKPAALSFLDAFSGTAAFWLGVAIGVGGLATIGFLTLLVSIL
ncbi:hypothetical protein HY478_03270 [Candidatus Uhrbacteria bacterium]|nr:hypothetical protein [Candidatus Uhrbacteria bacterium]